MKGIKTIREYWNVSMNSTWERWGERQQRSMHRVLWYSRSKDLSNLIFVRDIRQAIVIPPISQGKAPKWHDGIHLKKIKTFQSLHYKGVS